MSNGLRFFLVDGDDITHLPLKLTEDFFLRQGKFLPQYAGQDITIATVSYELEGRKPTLVTAIGCRGYRVTEEGALDEAHCLEAIKAAMYDAAEPTPSASKSDQTCDPGAALPDPCGVPLESQLSALARKRILEALFR